jgi:hypothetical protein
MKSICFGLVLFFNFIKKNGMWKDSKATAVNDPDLLPLFFTKCTTKYYHHKATVIDGSGMMLKDCEGGHGDCN